MENDGEATRKDNKDSRLSHFAFVEAPLMQNADPVLGPSPGIASKLRWPACPNMDTKFPTQGFDRTFFLKQILLAP